MEGMGETGREPQINKLFRVVVKVGGTALLLEPDQAPTIRLGEDEHRAEMQPLTQEDIVELLRPIMKPEQQLVLDGAGEVEFVHLLDAPERRIRVRVANRQGHVRAVAYPLPF